MSNTAKEWREWVLWDRALNRALWEVGKEYHDGFVWWLRDHNGWFIR